MDEFLTAVYPHYDLVVWSQTSWRWLETKLIELGMLANPGYKFCFVLDKTSMFTVTSTRRDGSSVTHHVKPLQLIWSKFADRWSSKNTVHIDDLGRNFALNLGSGIKISAYYRKKSSARRDAELLGLLRYLEELAQSKMDFDDVEFGNLALWFHRSSLGSIENANLEIRSRFSIMQIGLEAVVRCDHHEGPLRAGTVADPVKLNIYTF